MDIREDHEESDEHEEQDNSGASRNKFKKKLLLWCSIILSCALITAIIVYTINYEQGRRKGLLGNIQVDIPETFSEKPDVSGESGSDKEIEEISSEPEADMPDITEPGFSPVIWTDDGANPDMSSISIRFELVDQTQVAQVLYDQDLNRITTLFSGNFEPNEYRLMWNGLNDRSTYVNPGIYIIRLMTPTRSYFHKIVWLSDR